MAPICGGKFVYDAAARDGKNFLLDIYFKFMYNNYRKKKMRWHDVG